MLFLLYESLKDSEARRVPQLPALPHLPHRRGGRRPRCCSGMLVGPPAHRAAAPQAARPEQRPRGHAGHAPEEEGHADDGRRAILRLHRRWRRCCSPTCARASVWVALLLTFGYGFIGFLDDWLKLSKRNCKGLAGQKKMVLQTLFYLVGVFGILCTWTGRGSPHLLIDTQLTLPFVPTHRFNPDLGWLYVFFGWVVVVGTSTR